MVNYMKTILKKVGAALREKREELGWSLDQAAKTSGLSKTMCFRLERGDDTTKIDHYETYAGALGLVFDELVNEIQGIDLLHQELVWVETDIDLARGRDLLKTLRKIKELNISSKHPYMQIVEYLKGKAYFYSRKYEKAEKALRRAINLADRHIEKYAHLNIITSAYNVLSNIYYAYNQYETALELANESTALFVEGGEREIEYHMALLNKCVFLEKLNRLSEAERIAQYLWENLHRIHKSDTQAAICEHYARIQIQMNNSYKEAREAIRLGLDISRRNNLPHRASDLALVWGKIHEMQNEERQAEHAYCQALRFLPTIRVFNALGNMYLRYKNLDKAIESFKKSLDFELETNRPGYVEALIGLGKAYLLQNRKEEAIEVLKKAESLAHDMRDKSQETSSLLAKAYKEIDETQRIHYLEKVNEKQLEAILT